MNVEGNGAPISFHLDVSGQVLQELKALAQSALEKGIGLLVKKALQTVIRRLREAPLDFGELVRHRKHLKLLEHVGYVAPLRVWFAIHQELHFVVIRKVELVIPE